jgi:RHS repeat-associated protein
MKDEVVRVTAAETGYRVFGVGEYTSAGVWKKLYLSLNGHKFLEYANGTTYFFHTDHLGAPRAQSNLSAGVVETWRAYPYGEQWQQSGGAGATHHYTGKERDPESANDYFGARYYYAPSGRWLGLDPWVGDPHKPVTLNRYSYALNDPINYADPDGAFPVISTCWLLGHFTWGEERYYVLACSLYFRDDPRQKGTSGGGEERKGMTAPEEFEDRPPCMMDDHEIPAEDADIFALAFGMWSEMGKWFFENPFLAGAAGEVILNRLAYYQKTNHPGVTIADVLLAHDQFQPFGPNSHDGLGPQRRSALLSRNPLGAIYSFLSAQGDEAVRQFSAILPIAAGLIYGGIPRMLPTDTCHFFSPAGLRGKPWPNWYKEEKATVVDPELFIGVSGVTPTRVKYSGACR